ncbi:unnamed protein product [Withania somnifera]
MSSDSTQNRIPLWRQILQSTVLIIRSHSLHFYALSILFLLPIFFTLVVYPSFHLALFHPHYNFNISTQPQFSHSSFEIIVFLMLTVLVVVFFLCAIATITYSSVQPFHDRSINLVSSIKSIRNSFIPLLSTFIILHSIFLSITIIFTLVFVFLLQNLGLTELKYNSNHFWFLLILVIVPILLWLELNWSLAYVIAAAEYKCGFETLRRSAYLMKGMRWLAFWTHLFYWLTLGGMVIGSNVVFVLLGAGKGDHWRSFSFIGQTVQCTVLGALGMNQVLVFNGVLYMYSKDLKGEKLPFDYISLPLGDEKKNHNIV